MDKLEITDLKISTRIGVHVWEQQILQPLFINLQLFYDFSKSNDSIENTLDYDKVCQLVTSYVSEHHFKLIETVAEKVCDLIKREFNIEKILVKVCKPTAIKNAKNVCVIIER